MLHALTHELENHPARHLANTAVGHVSDAEVNDPFLVLTAFLKDINDSEWEVDDFLGFS